VFQFTQPISLASDALFADAMRRLIEVDDPHAASVLLSCTLFIERLETSSVGIDAVVKLRAPVHIYEMAQAVDAYRELLEYAPGERNSDAEAKARTISLVESAIRGAMPERVTVVDIQFAAEPADLDDPGRAGRIENDGRKKGVEITTAEESRTSSTSQFGSRAHTQVASSLEKAGVLFIANCGARLGQLLREHRRFDFLVCQRGKWGILEIDQPHSSTERHKNGKPPEMLYLTHGIKVVQHFDATQCLENPDRVVKTFLFALEQS